MERITIAVEDEYMGIRYRCEMCIDAFSMDHYRGLAGDMLQRCVSELRTRLDGDIAAVKRKRIP
jgi:hypothetical protein